MSENCKACGATLPSTTLTPKQLGELVADAARDHGAQCAKNGSAYTSPAWHEFRCRLAELVKRAER